MLSDIAFGVLLGIMGSALTVPLYRAYRDRVHIWVKCETAEETERLADRVAGYSEMHPTIDAALRNGKIVHYVRVPKCMLVDVKQDEAIKKLKEPLSV